MGIFDLIQPSRTGPSYCQNLLVTSLYYWESTTNTFQLPCGMLTPTLFDVVAITDLRPDGDNFDHNEQDKNKIEFDNNHDGFTKYIEDTMSLKPPKLLLKSIPPSWPYGSLDAYICCKSLKVAKRYLTLSNQLHEGNNVCIS